MLCQCKVLGRPIYVALPLQAKRLLLDMNPGYYGHLGTTSEVELHWGTKVCPLKRNYLFKLLNNLCNQEISAMKRNAPNPSCSPFLFDFLSMDAASLWGAWEVRSLFVACTLCALITTVSVVLFAQTIYPFSSSL